VPARRAGCGRRTCFERAVRRPRPEDRHVTNHARDQGLARGATVLTARLSAPRLQGVGPFKDLPTTGDSKTLKKEMDKRANLVKVHEYLKLGEMKVTLNMKGSLVTPKGDWRHIGISIVAVLLYGCLSVWSAVEFPSRPYQTHPHVEVLAVASIGAFMVMLAVRPTWLALSVFLIVENCIFALLVLLVGFVIYNRFWVPALESLPRLVLGSLYLGWRFVALQLFLYGFLKIIQRNFH